MSVRFEKGSGIDWHAEALEMLNSKCGQCGKHTKTMYEVQGYAGTYLFCEQCFKGDEIEDGFDRDWVDE